MSTERVNVERMRHALAREAERSARFVRWERCSIVDVPVPYRPVVNRARNSQRQTDQITAPIRRAIAAFAAVRLL